jgi:Spy/CpxP family protein refolding chaperone
MTNRLYLVLFLIAAFAGVAAAQDMPAHPPNDPDRPNRPNLLRELGLSQEQIQQIRRLNAERRPQMEAAQRRLRQANRALDVAIYSESTSDAEFQARLTEFQSAQGDLSRLRFSGELAVRKILTPEQLSRFRELRQRFAKRMDGINDDRRRRRRQDGTPAIDSPRDRRNLPPEGRPPQ